MPPRGKIDSSATPAPAPGCDPSGWIQTFSGKAFEPLNPRQFDVVDIGHALSQQCRYTGHTRRFYSVAEHSVRVSMLAETYAGSDKRLALVLARQGLLHDASEAYLADIAAPIKHLPQLAGYRELEKQVERALFRHFELPEDMAPEVKRADMVLLATERLELLGPEPRPWGTLPAPLTLPQGFGWSSTYAEAQFAARFARLARMGAAL